MKLSSLDDIPGKASGEPWKGPDEWKRRGRNAKTSSMTDEDLNFAINASLPCEPDGMTIRCII